MLKLIIKQANWSVLGTVFGFAIGFFVKIYLIDIVGLQAWGKYVIAQTFSSFVETVLSIGIPFVIIKFIPTFIENNKEKASRIASIFLKYAVVVGSVFLGIVYFSSDLINQYIYNDVSGLNWILFVMCIHVPISMLFGVVLSLYRSVLKIKEIVLYGTFIAVTLRALLTFIIFQFTDDISHFILIEVCTQILVLSILLYLFNKNEFSLFVTSESKEVTSDTKMIAYGKKMFLNSIIAFISGWALSFIISIKLSSVDVGAYNILLTLTGLTTFLLINLNRVFAPAISKLYHEGNFFELGSLYKKTTFLINVLTIPLAIIIATFADEILGLYTVEMLKYKDFLFFMLVGGMLSLAAGSSGTFMIMAGLEKKELQLQTIKAVLITGLAFAFVSEYKMLAIVSLYVIFMLFINVSQLIYIKKNVSISPFSADLLKLFGLTIICMYFAINQSYNFKLIHFILIPIGV
ncbi:MAG: oligosaccharide flippase family protein, partial [Bacteroidetes bacterium]|nr:oligosaccharide flippase family protein [Bacteroidota bacterium]